MARRIGIVQYWGGCPETPSSKWRRFLAVIQGCAHRGWRTYLVWSRMPDDRDLWRPFVESGCEIILHPRPVRSIDLRCVLRTYRLLRRIRCDVLHCHNVHTSPLIAAALAGVAIRIWSKLSMPEWHQLGVEPSRWDRLAPSVRISCALAHRVLAISNAVRDELLQRGISGRKVSVLPAPIPVESYANASPHGVRESLGLRKSDVLVTSVGHAVPVKGWDVLIQAFAHAAPVLSQARLLLVGSTMGRNEIGFFHELEMLARRLGVADKVHFLGRRDDVPALLAASDIFVFPTRSEGQGCALTEALAVGLPCVAARVGGVPEQMVHGKNGLLFDREDVASLADALHELASNACLRRSLGANGRKAARRFGMEEVTNRLLELYERLAVNHLSYANRKSVTTHL